MLKVNYVLYVMCYVCASREYQPVFRTFLTTLVLRDFALTTMQTTSCHQFNDGALHSVSTGIYGLVRSGKGKPVDMHAITNLERPKCNTPVANVGDEYSKLKCKSQKRESKARGRRPSPVCPFSNGVLNKISLD